MKEQRLPPIYIEILHEAATNAKLPTTDILREGHTMEDFLKGLDKLYKEIRPLLSEKTPTYTFCYTSKADPEKRRLQVETYKSFLQRKGGHVDVYDMSQSQNLEPLSDVRLIFTLDFGLA